MINMEKFIKLYKSLGIKIKTNPISEKYHYPLNDDFNVSEGFEIRLKSHSHSKFFGYSGFYTIIVFDKNGKFLGQGFYE